MVGYFGLLPLRLLLGVPQDGVQVREVVVQVDALHAVAAQGPAGQLRALDPPTTPGTETHGSASGPPGGGAGTPRGRGRNPAGEGLTL